MTTTNNLWRKRLTFWTKLALQIIALLIAGMFWTFITEYLQQLGFFGDVRRATPSTDTVDEMYDWGVRHYWWQVISIISFILAALRIIMWGDWFWSDHNKKSY